MSLQRLSSRTVSGDLLRYPLSSSREPDPFWVEVRTAASSGRLSQIPQTHIASSVLGAGEGEEDDEQEGLEDGEEGGSGVVEVTGQAMTSAVVLPYVPFGERRMSKREKNRIKCLRRRQRRRERWRQSQLQESRQGEASVAMIPQELCSLCCLLCDNDTPWEAGCKTLKSPEPPLGENRVITLEAPPGFSSRGLSHHSSASANTGNPSSSSSEDEEDVSAGDREGFICAVCLDVFFSPYMCHPCNHVFCEPCLRTLAKGSPTNTPCPLCRTIITHVFFQKELNQTARTFFPKEYLSRKQNFQKANCAKWPLPSCRKLFRIFGGFQRQSSPIARRQFPHGGGYRLDALDFEDDSRGWRFDMDMVIIYIYSVNWVIGFFIFCFLCYIFFPSF
ncbi:hypothetical protein NQZ68_040665 [Dissostichus eleginoides]|nr:hypothetical protein NQZ68_040665 [Dissostichus eleginoides]